MRIFALACFVLVGLVIGASAQSKTLEQAQTQLAAFQSSAEFSLRYEETRYVTIASVKVDSIADNQDLKKQFKKLEWQLESYFAIKGIDETPVRVVLCLATQSKRFAFTSDRELTLNFDGEDIMLGEAQRTSEVKGGKARENLCWEVDSVITEHFEKATNASFAVGTVRGKFSPATLKGFKDYGALVIVAN